MQPYHSPWSCSLTVHCSPLPSKSKLTETTNLLRGLPLGLTPGTSALKILFGNLENDSIACNLNYKLVFYET